MLLLVLALSCLQEPTPAIDPAAERGARIAALLVREEAPDAAASAALRAEILALGPIEPELLRVLADWQTAPLGEEGPARLNLAQRALVLACVSAVPRASWKEIRAQLPQASEPATLRAGLRLEATLARPSALRDLYALVRRAQELGCLPEVAEAFEEALVTLVAREPEVIDSLRTAWRELDPPAAECVVRALAEVPSEAALECLWAWLGRRSELDPPLLLALGKLHAFVDPERHDGLVLDVQARLAERDTAVVLAATNALGRFGTSDSVPWLIELLVHEEAPVQRSALNALRDIGGVRLPASSTAWRSWYAREETWFQEHAPALLAELVAAEADEEPEARTHALLRDLAAHRLHRHELARHVRPLLQHERARLRVLACQALERLGSRACLAWLVDALSDEDPTVVSAANAALRTFEGVLLAPEPEVWRARLGLAAPGGSP